MSVEPPVPSPLAAAGPPAVPTVAGLAPANGAATGPSTGASRPAGLASCPPPERWDDWAEPAAGRLAGGAARRSVIVPTLCEACHAGLLAYVDRETWRIWKFEGNPFHPLSRGRTCPACRATLNRLDDTERLRHPLRRVAGRGHGFWERATWDEALDAIATRLRRAIDAGRQGDVAVAPGAAGYHDLIPGLIAALGLDALAGPDATRTAALHLGNALWLGAAEPAVDYTGATLVLALGSPLDGAGDYVDAAQSLAAARRAGTRLEVMAPVLTAGAAFADRWLAVWPGAEAAVLLAVAKVLLDEDRIDRAFVEQQTNWAEYLAAAAPEAPEAAPDFGQFLRRLQEHLVTFTPQFAEAESGLAAGTVVELARSIAAAGRAFRGVATAHGAGGNLGGWQAVRALRLLETLVGSLAPVAPPTCQPAAWGEASARPVPAWNALLWPPEWPLAGAPAAVLPRLLGGEHGALAALISREFNPLHTHPDGFAWLSALRDEAGVEFYAELASVWHETAWFADFVLPVGLPGERTGLRAGATAAGRWVALEQPAVHTALNRLGRAPSPEAGDVRDEADVWLEIAWRVDADGALGLRRQLTSAARPGERVTVEEHYARQLDRLMPELAEVAAGYQLSALGYLQRFGAFSLDPHVERPPLPPPVAPPAPAPAAPVTAETALAAAPTPGPEATADQAGEAAPTGVDAAVPAPAEPESVATDVPDADAAGAGPLPAESAGAADPVEDTPVVASQPPAATLPGPMPAEVATGPAPGGGGRARPWLAAQAHRTAGARTRVAVSLVPLVSGRVRLAARGGAGPVSANGHAAGEAGSDRETPPPAPERVEVVAAPARAWPTPSGKLEIYSSTLRDWRWGDYALPGYIRGQVGRHMVNRQRGEFALVPTELPPPFDDPTGATAKWLLQIANARPLWLHPADAARLGLSTGAALRVRTEIGHFICRAWLTQSVRPGVVALSRSGGRWRRQDTVGVSRWSSWLAELRGPGIGSTPTDPVSAVLASAQTGKWQLRPLHGVEPFDSADPDTRSIVPRPAEPPATLAFPSHPDPVSGQHAWCQKVIVEAARPEDVPGSIEVDAQRAALVYRDWLKLTRPAPGPERLRRPRWLPRPGRPAPAAYELPEPPAPAPTDELPVPPELTGLAEPAVVAAAPADSAAAIDPETMPVPPADAGATESHAGESSVVETALPADQAASAASIAGEKPSAEPPASPPPAQAEAPTTVEPVSNSG